jgi:hypothetical protein
MARSSHCAGSQQIPASPFLHPQVLAAKISAIAADSVAQSNARATVEAAKIQRNGVVIAAIIAAVTAVFCAIIALLTIQPPVWVVTHLLFTRADSHRMEVSGQQTLPQQQAIVQNRPPISRQEQIRNSKSGRPCLTKENPCEEK